MLIAVSVLVFLLSSLSTAFYIRNFCTFNSSSTNCYLFETALGRVLINDVLFLIFGFILMVFLYKLARLSRAVNIPEHDVSRLAPCLKMKINKWIKFLCVLWKNLSIFKAVLISVCITLFLVSRTVYNLVAISTNYLPDFGFDWINVSDQVRRKLTFLTWNK